MYLMITNNPLVVEKLKSKASIKFDFQEEWTNLEVLEKVRDYIHKGYRLETHPMAGSVKPNQNPYKSVLILDDKCDSEEFMEYIMVIENGIASFKKFLAQRELPKWEERLLEDFRVVDLSLIESAADHLR